MSTKSLVTAYTDFVRAAAVKCFGRDVELSPEHGTKTHNGENVVHVTPNDKAFPSDVKRFEEFCKSIHGVESVVLDPTFKVGSFKIVFQTPRTSAFSRLVELSREKS